MNRNSFSKIILLSIITCILFITTINIVNASTTGYPVILGYKGTELHAIGYDETGLKFNKSLSGFSNPSPNAYCRDQIQWLDETIYFWYRNTTGYWLFKTTDLFTTIEDCGSIIAAGSNHVGFDMQYSDQNGMFHFMYAWTDFLYYRNYTVATDTWGSQILVDTVANDINSLDFVLIEEGGLDKLYVVYARYLGRVFCHKERINGTWSNRYEDGEYGASAVSNLIMDYNSNYDEFVVTCFLSSGTTDRIKFTHKDRSGLMWDWELYNIWEEITSWQNLNSNYRMVSNDWDNTVVVMTLDIGLPLNVGISISSAPAFVWTEIDVTDGANFSGTTRGIRPYTASMWNKTRVHVQDITNWNIYAAGYEYYKHDHTIGQMASKKICNTAPLSQFLGLGAKHYSMYSEPEGEEPSQNTTLVIGEDHTVLNNTLGDYLFPYESYYLDSNTKYYNESIFFAIQDERMNWLNVTYFRGNRSIKHHTESNSFELMNYVEDFTNVTAGDYDYELYFVLTQDVFDSGAIKIVYRLKGLLNNGTIVDSGYKVISGYKIYNLGGIVTYETSGWANRITDGLPFEIYAADTRAPIMIDWYDFDMSEFAFPVGYDEEELLRILQNDWYIQTPIRTATYNMYPTNRLDSYADATDRAYNSSPYGFRIFADNVDNNRQMYIEKNFRRRIRASDNELVSIEWSWMNPDVDVNAIQFRVQQDSIKLTGSGYMALQIRFDSSGNIDVFNRTAAGWTDLLAVNDYDWYRMRANFNLSTQNVEIFIDGISQGNVVFTEATCTQLNTVFIGLINTVTTTNDAYFDDIFGYTNFGGDYGGKARAESVYRKLNTWSTHYGYFIETPDGIRPNGMKEGNITIGIDIDFGTGFNRELWVQIMPQNLKMNKRNNWIEYNISWFHISNPNVAFREETVYGLFEADNLIKEDIIQREITSFFTDFWIDVSNSSSTIAGRLNLEWYGVSDVSPFWAFWSKNWQPKLTDKEMSLVSKPILDGSSNIRKSTEIRLIRIWVEVYRTSVGTFSHKFTYIRMNDKKEQFGTNPLMGVDEPPFTAPKVPEMKHGIFLNPLYSIFSALAKMLMNVLVSSVLAVASVIDSLLVALGLPPLFSIILSFIGAVISMLQPLIAAIPLIIGNVATIINNVLSLFTMIVGRWVFLLTGLISSQITFLRYLIGFFTGDFLGMDFNIWQDFSLGDWLVLFIDIIFPVWWVNRVLSSKNPVDTAFTDMRNFYGFMMGIINFTFIIVGFINSIISAILSILPI